MDFQLVSFAIRLESTHIDLAINELQEIKNELSKISPDKVVWDFDDLSIQPPWRVEIIKDITSLANYFVTSDGEDLSCCT